MTMTRRRRGRLAIAAVSACALVVPVLPIDTIGAAPPVDTPDPSWVRRDPTTGKARTLFEAGTYLTGPSRAPAEQIVLRFVRRHADLFGLTARDLGSLVVDKSYVTAHNGATTVIVGQRVNGIRVYRGILTAAVDADGRLVLVGGSVAATATSGAARLDAEQAIGRAAAHAGAPQVRLPAAAGVRAAGGHEFRNPYDRGPNATPASAELVWFPVDGGDALRLAWLTDVEFSGQVWNATVVDATTGAVLDVENRYAHSGPEGNVFQEQHPDMPGAAQQITPFTGLDGSWVSGTTTSGNNVNAYRDLDDNDANDEYQPTDPDAHFDYVFTDDWRNDADGDDESLDADIDAVITQLFYYTNVMHDWLYGYGFDEAAGNFQVDNFGRGGSGGDPVLAEAQDGWDFGCVDDKGNEDPSDDEAVRCMNNANFGTPADGGSPRMQMYMWAPTRPYRDGSMDGDVIAHEYGHGVSSRLVGGGNLGYANNQSGALGEGWSDTISFLKWGDTTVGEYVTGNTTRGIRSTAYDTSTLTYGDYDPNAGSPHPNGEIWASVMYDIREFLGLDATTQLVIDGMKYTLATPDFLDARTGIYVADLLTNGGTNLCMLATVFANRGMGISALSGGLDGPVFENFTIPSSCLPTADAGGPYATDEGIDVEVSASGSSSGSDVSAGAIVSYEWDLDGDGQYDDAVGETATFDDVGQDGITTIGVRVTDEFGNTDTDSSSVTVANVAPAVSIDAITPIDELGSVRVTGTVTDPGWEEALTATIDWGDGNGAVPLGGSLENVRPDATLAFDVTHQYGDDGVFTVTVTGFDDDTSSDDTEPASVANVDPTAVIDLGEQQSYGGSSAFVLEAGEELDVPASSSDPGSDDLEFTWDWDDASVDTQTSLVNPPAADPPMSPSVQPRDVSLSQAHTYLDACLYELEVTVVDDDGGSATQTASIVITGNGDIAKGHGWWLNQLRNKQPNDFSQEEIDCYLEIVGFFSLVFPTLTRAEATEILNTPPKAAEEIQFDQQALAAWLNFADGSVKLDTPVDTDLDGIDDSTFGEVMFTAETVRTDPSSTREEIQAQEKIVKAIVTQSA
jgi:hypothetical protein